MVKYRIWKYNNNSLIFFKLISNRLFLNDNMVETSKTKYVPSIEKKYNFASIGIHTWASDKYCLR